VRRALLVLAFAASFLVGAWGFSDAAPGDLLRTNNSGGNQTLVPKIPGTPCWRVGNQTFRPDGTPFSACTPTTSTTVAATTSTTSTTPSTSVAPTTTQAPITTSTSTSTSSTTSPPLGGDFVETFTTADALERFRTGVYHRGDDAQGDWLADHADHGTGDCGNPVTTSRLAHSAIPAEALFVCTSVDGDPTKGHLMTTMGDVTGYSIVWFTPDQTFTAATTDEIRFEASVTELNRKWWEILITPVGAPDLQCVTGFTPCGLPVDGYHPGSVVMALDNVNIDNVERDVWGAGNYCFGPFEEDPEGCHDKRIRRQFSIVDNNNGTITFTFDTFGSRTYPGSFPAEFKVVFKDHNYTPDKDGFPGGYTWHWDNVEVR
jgi:hypothetical protein